MLANVCLLNNLIYLDNAIVDGMFGLFLTDQEVFKSQIFRSKEDAGLSFWNNKKERGFFYRQTVTGPWL